MAYITQKRMIKLLTENISRADEQGRIPQGFYFGISALTEIATALDRIATVLEDRSHEFHAVIRKEGEF